MPDATTFLELPADARAFLDRRPPRFGTLASINEDGSPHQAVLWYRLQADGGILLNSRVGRRWPTNLLRDPRASFSVEDEYEWVSLRGDAVMLRGGEGAQEDIAALARLYDTEDEAEVRRVADALYRRADWVWACNGGPTLTHGWKPETGFLPYRYEGYDEGLLLYLLALGSPTHALPPESYAAYCATYQWKEIFGRELLYSGPLFTHQLSHLWVDFRGIRDAFMRERGSDYFENSRQATYVQQEYAIRNPLEFEGYGKYCWGFTACDGPGWIKRSVNGIERQFFDYIARGAPFGPDDGTVAPWVVVASLPFAPEIVIPHGPPLREAEPGNDRPLWVQGVVQPDLRC